MLFDWAADKNELTKSVPGFARRTTDSLKGYQTLCDANKANSPLGEKTRQLISLAVAVTTRCDGCITFHSAMNAGAALIYSLRAIDGANTYSGKYITYFEGQAKTEADKRRPFFFLQSCLLRKALSALGKIHVGGVGTKQTKSRARVSVTRLGTHFRNTSRHFCEDLSRQYHTTCRGKMRLD